MEAAEARALCERFLPLWTGNRPEALVRCYTEDAFYRDPGKPDGLRGRLALLGYFSRLLARYPDWVWECGDVFPLEGGFVLRWRATIPVGREIVRETGMDLVLVRDGLVAHNEVYFDRAALLAAEARRSGSVPTVR